jgi:hypothetical protein
VTGLTLRAMLKGALTFKAPKYYLFFTRTANGRRAAKAFLERLKERTDDPRHSDGDPVVPRAAQGDPRLGHSGPTGSARSRSQSSSRMATTT